jgi:hypothetical protein
MYYFVVTYKIDLELTEAIVIILMHACMLINSTVDQVDEVLKLS